MCAPTSVFVSHVRWPNPVGRDDLGAPGLGGQGGLVRRVFVLSTITAPGEGGPMGTLAPAEVGAPAFGRLWGVAFLLEIFGFQAGA